MLDEHGMIEVKEDPAQAVASRTVDADGRAQTVVEQELNSIDGSVRTAIAVEPRDGRLNIFLPPTESADDYVDLINAIEQHREDP